MEFDFKIRNYYPARSPILYDCWDSITAKENNLQWYQIVQYSHTKKARNALFGWINPLGWLTLAGSPIPAEQLDSQPLTTTSHCRPIRYSWMASWTATAQPINSKWTGWKTWAYAMREDNGRTRENEKSCFLHFCIVIDIERWQKKSIADMEFDFKLLPSQESNIIWLLRFCNS